MTSLIVVGVRAEALEALDQRDRKRRRARGPFGAFFVLTVLVRAWFGRRRGFVDLDAALQQRGAGSRLVSPDPVPPEPDGGVLTPSAGSIRS